MAWTIVKIGGEGENYGDKHIEYQIDEQEDIKDLPKNQAPGCAAYNAELTLIYRTDNNGNWKKVGG